LQCRPDDDLIIHPESFSVKENAAASTRNLDISALLFHLREQMAPPSAPSRPSLLHWFVHCVHHFERMLYDNSQLARVYLHAWQVTGNEFFRTITEEILDYVVSEMLNPEGGFYSTQDADSEGEEGKFFVWTPDEIREVLGSDADEFMAAYGVTRHGNFEGKNILEFVGDIGQRPALAEARRKLYEIREERVHPGHDEKVLTSWNGLMLTAFAEAARVSNRNDYRAKLNGYGGSCSLGHQDRAGAASPKLDRQARGGLGQPLSLGLS
jgi:hypothetical protein